MVPFSICQLTCSRLAFSSSLPSRKQQCDERGVVEPEKGAWHGNARSEEPQIPFDLDMPEAVRRDPFAPEAAPSLARPAEVLPAPKEQAALIHATVPALTSEQIARLKQAAQEFRRGNPSGGEALSAATTDPNLKLAIEWLALRSLKQSAGFQRITAFLAANPDFPMAQWLRRRAEEALFIETLPAETVRSFFATTPPEMAGGKIALARVLNAAGETKSAEALVREAYRDNKTTAGLRTAIQKDFPGAISASDQRYLAERLIYDGASAEGLRVATGAGPATLRIAQALALSLAESAATAAHLQKLDAAELKQPAVQFARAQLLRRTGKFSEAAEVMAAVPRDADRIVDGDEWWTERRLLARKLLDQGDPQRAYEVAAGHLAESSASVVDAEVHAGWIALRFLKQAGTAARHFAAARSSARTPASIARAAYWQGRAADAGADTMADLHYLAAAGHRHSYYGQLSRDRLGGADGPERQPQLDNGALETAAKSGAFRVIRALIDADALDFAQPLIIDLASTAATPEPLVVLGDLLTQYRQTRLTVVVGKLAMQRGLPLEGHAFPTGGLPEFEATPASAEAAIVIRLPGRRANSTPRRSRMPARAA
jgi:soluble lytic murein transglycosylase